LKFLHQSQQQTTRPGNIKTKSSATTSAGVKHPPQKPKVSLPITNRVVLSTVQNKPAKVSPRPITSKPKVPQTTTIKSEKPRSAPIPKKVTKLVNILLINIVVFLIIDTSYGN
jgi:hypothetical protein